MVLNAEDQALVKALQDGLPLDERPYRCIAARAGLDEETVIKGIARLKEKGIIKRMGVIVHHRELGYSSNAMVVWDVPDELVDQVGEWLGSQEGVHLCYRRPRRPPHWPYNLFCMIHGQDRAGTRKRIHGLRRNPVLGGVPYAVLFSTRRFKQRGARYRFDPVADRTLTDGSEDHG